MGSASDAPYSGTGTPTSVYSLYNGASSGLIQAQNLIVGANGVAAANSTPLVDSSFTTNFTAASQLTSANVTEIATDISTSANAFDLEVALCVANAEAGGASQSTAFGECDTVPPPTPAVTEFTGTIQPEVASAASSWPQLHDLIGNLGSVTGLNSVDTATITSSGTVTAANQPIAYNITETAASGGYMLPSAFTFTFPGGLSVNTALVGAEVNAAANGTTPAAIAAVEANPSGTPIGTVTLTSPLADSYGGSNNQLAGKIYVVQTGATSGQGSVTQPYLELWFGPYIYTLGAFPGSLSFPLTIQFGEAATPLGAEPLPTTSLALSFPAATSPVKSASCTTLGTVTGTATDSLANLAYEFGDTSDGVSSTAGTAQPVNLAASATAVTNKCVKPAATGSAGGLTNGHPTLTLKAKTTVSFGTVTVGLPGGLKFVKSKKLAKEVSATGAKVKSVKIAGGKLVITLKSKVTSVTVKTKKGAVSESAALIKSIKKHKTKKLNVSVKAGNTSLKASIKA